MKRLGIFCFYEKKGVVGRYIEYLLNDLKNVLDNLIVVVNGSLNDNGYKIFKKYADRIVIRENIGYDAGAYKDIIVNYLGEDKIKYYEQIILCNDTFYGPFIHFTEIFAKMNKTQADFWGLNYLDSHLAPHIQSYFLVIGSSIIRNGDLYKFFQSYIDEKETMIEEIYAKFEVGITKFFTRLGYWVSAFASPSCCDIYYSSNYSIKRYNLPVIKKKCFSQGFFDKNTVMDSLQYIKKHLDYNIELILEDIRYAFDMNYTESDVEAWKVKCTAEIDVDVAKVERKQVEDFFTANEKIYIYGAGIVARIVCCSYLEYLSKIKGIVVSDGQEIDTSHRFYGYDIKHISDIDSKESAVLIALNPQHTKEVVGGLEGKCKKILTLW